MAKKTIKRSPKDADNPYRMINRHAMEDDRLSFEARGVLAYVLVKPDNWRVKIADLRRAGNIGRDKAYRILNELVVFGYVIREIERNVDGTISEMVYLVDEKPTNIINPPPENQDVDGPLPEKPDTAEPDTAEPDTVFQDHNNKEGTSNKEGISKEEDIHDDDDDARVSFSLFKVSKENSRARAVRGGDPTIDTELVALREAAQRMVEETLGARSWDGWAQYRDRSTKEQLRLVCYWCKAVADRWLTSKSDDPIANPVGFVRYGVEQGIYPGIAPIDQQLVDDYITLLAEMKQAL